MIVPCIYYMWIYFFFFLIVNISLPFSFLFIFLIFFFYFTILYWFCHTSTCICPLSWRAMTTGKLAFFRTCLYWWISAVDVFQKTFWDRFLKYFFYAASIKSISESMMNHETHLLTNKTLHSLSINPIVPPLFQLPAVKYYSETWNLLLEKASINLVVLQQVHLAIQQVYPAVLILSIYSS